MTKKGSETMRSWGSSRKLVQQSSFDELHVVLHGSLDDLRPSWTGRRELAMDAAEHDLQARRLFCENDGDAVVRAAGEHVPEDCRVDGEHHLADYDVIAVGGPERDGIGAGKRSREVAH